MVRMPVPTQTMLAQSGARSANAATEIIVYAGALLVAVLIVIVVAVLVRRLLLRSSDPSDAGGFTLAEMRRMHEAGELSDEEWESAKAALRAHTRRAAGVADDADELDPPAPASEIDSDNPPPPQDDDNDDAGNDDQTGHDRPAGPGTPT